MVAKEYEVINLKRVKSAGLATVDDPIKPAVLPFLSVHCACDNWMSLTLLLYIYTVPPNSGTIGIQIVYKSVHCLY